MSWVHVVGHPLFRVTAYMAMSTGIAPDTVLLYWPPLLFRVATYMVMSKDWHSSS